MRDAVMPKRVLTSDESATVATHYNSKVPLLFTELTQKGAPFKFGESQVAAQEDLKDALIHSPALQAINYTSDSPVILAVDTSHIAVGFFLCQCDSTNPKIRHYNRFGSITLNDWEARFSQPKLEIL